jgi:F-type H+-transporting ATPase subunit b
MQIDWVTVGAQIINFLILVYLLKRFLYGPIIRAMDQREARIARRLGQADQREREAEAQSTQYLEQRQRLQAQEQQLLDQAREQAEEERARRLASARSEIEKQREAWREKLESEKRDFLGGLKRQLAKGVQTVSRRALAEMADAELESQLAATFIRHLEAVDEKERAQMAGSGEPLRVLTAFELAPGTRSSITRALHKLIKTDMQVNYDRSDELLCGIELIAGERRMGWSIDGYLDELSRRIESTLEGDRAFGGEGD